MTSLSSPTPPVPVPHLDKTSSLPDTWPQLADLRAAKKTAKYRFTVTRNKLERILSSDLPSRREVKKVKSQLEEKFNDIIPIISQLIVLNEEEADQLTSWMTQVEHDYEETKSAEEYLIRRRSEASSIPSETTSSSASRTRSWINKLPSLGVLQEQLEDSIEDQKLQGQQLMSPVELTEMSPPVSLPNPVYGAASSVPDGNIRPIPTSLSRTAPVSRAHLPSSHHPSSHGLALATRRGTSMTSLHEDQFSALDHPLVPSTANCGGRQQQVGFPADVGQIPVSLSSPMQRQQPVDARTTEFSRNPSYWWDSMNLPSLGASDKEQDGFLPTQGGVSSSMQASYGSYVQKSPHHRRDQQKTTNLDTAGLQTLPDPTEQRMKSMPVGMPLLNTQLKNIELKKFSGKEDFFEFRRTFNFCVHSRAGTGADKLLYLRSVLEGEALEKIRGFGYSDRDYALAWERLDRSYGTPERFWDHSLDMLEDVKPCKHKHIKDHESLIVALDNVILAMTEQNQTGELGRGMLYRLAYKKMAEASRYEYEKWVRDRRLVNNLSSLHQFLLDEVEIWKRTKFDLFKNVPQPQHKIVTSLTQSQTTTGSVKPEQKVVSNSTTSTKNNGARKLRTVAPTQSRNQRETRRTQQNCLACKKDVHPLFLCVEFKKMSLKEKWDFISKHKLCFGCFGQFHLQENCRTKRKCGIDGCVEEHNWLLHDRSTKTTSLTIPKEKQTPIPPQVQTEANVSSLEENQPLVLRTVPVILTEGDRTVGPILAMLDEDSTGNHVADEVVEELGIEGKPTSLSTKVYKGKRIKSRCEKLMLNISSLDGGVQGYQFPAYTTDTVTGDSDVVSWNDYKSKWNHLCDIEFPTVPGKQEIKLLIGNKEPFLHRALEERWGGIRDPVARLTPLGWTCIGPLEEETQDNLMATETQEENLEEEEDVGFFLQDKEQEIDQLLRSFCELENPKENRKLSMTPDEKLAMKIAESALELKDSRFTIGVPWKPGEPHFSNNYLGALKRLESTERSLNRRPELAKEYSVKFEKQISDGYIKIVPPEERDQNEFFLPHFGVIREDRTTTKLRIVFDCAAKFDGKSLNDAVFIGPKLQTNIIDVIVHFRRYPVVIVGDIHEMFPQIKIKLEDQKFHRFLWRDCDTKREPSVYQHQRVVFGNCASPFLAERVMEEIAARNEENYPELASTIRNSMIVDDVTESCPSEAHAIKLRHQLSDVLLKSGFHIRKWASNCPAVLDDIPDEDKNPKMLQKEIKSKTENEPQHKVLGILWSIQKDQFIFKVKSDFDLKISRTDFTKRKVLSKIASIFDPMQLLAPFVIRAKVLMQKIWIEGTNWDDPLSKALQNEWIAWNKDLQNLSHLSFPRWIGQSLEGTTTLHIFVDASNQACVAVAYARTVYPNKSVKIEVVMAKTKVAPIKTISIPRLELRAASMGANLVGEVSKVLNLSVFEATLWSDSFNVLFWIRSESRQYKPYVANRIGEIHEKTSPSQWRYVPTKLNPADLATRGLTVKEMEKSKWKTGPEFLTQEKSHWPEDRTNLKDTEAMKELKIQKEDKAVFEMRSSTADKEENEDLFQPFLDPERNDWKFLTRVIGWCYRFIHATRDKINTRKCEISSEPSHGTSTPRCRSGVSEVRSEVSKERILLPKDLGKSEEYWIRFAQGQVFANEIEHLEKGKSIPQNSKLLKLNPVLDERGMLRVSGRLTFADFLPRDQRQPIILPRNHIITRRLIVYYHNKLHHVAGVNHLFHELSSRFWIMKGREAVKEITYRCYSCRKRKAKPLNQMMSPLPNVRLKSTRPFDNTATDFAGPFFTKQQGRGQPQRKRYLCLFTCLLTRAVHLELAYSLDTDSFLMCMERFVSHRGKPSMILSDRGTNFVSANRELKDIFNKFDKEKLTQKFPQIEWKFNPPGTPHFGGVFEAMIKSSKKAIEAINTTASCTDEELSTVFAQAQRLLNNRPLSYQTSDSNDLIPLTPNHFLFGMLGHELTPPEATEEVATHTRKRWKYVQMLVDHTWKRWLKEIPNSLQKRQKWETSKENLKAGDVVICVDPRSARGDWPLGRVTKTIPGKDGLVRVATVRTRIGNQNKEVLRPINKLCLLVENSNTMYTEEQQMFSS